MTLEVRRRERCGDRRAREAAMPDLIDLFVLAASAGHGVWPSVLAVRDRAPGCLRPELDRLVREVEGGHRLGPALDRAGERLGPLGRPLTDALATALVTGAPLVGVLERVADTARVQRRHAAQERARRLPVLLLLPLVACILPALIATTVVPLLAASLAALGG